MSSPAGDPDLDAGLNPDPNIPDTSVSSARSRRFCGFDGQQFTTYLFPSGERVQALNVKNQFRSLGAIVGIDAVRGELFVESCTRSPWLAYMPVRQVSCSLDRFSVDDEGLAPPIHSIKLSPSETILSVISDPGTDNLIVRVAELVAERYIASSRILTLARSAVDLAAPIRRLDAYPVFEGLAALSYVGEALGFDAERGEIYVNREGQGVDVFARSASGSAEPSRRVTFSTTAADYLVSTVQGAYYRAPGSTLETYALPLVQDAVPLRTLTALPGSVVAIDEQRGELWTEGPNVFDLNASGGAVSLRSPPASFNRPKGAFPDADVMAFQLSQSGYEGGPIAFYSRTAVEGAPLRVLEGGGPFDDGYEFIGIDVQRREAFFLREDGDVTVYGLDATGDARPLRRIGTSLAPGTTLLDPSSAELLGTRNSELVAYPADAEGQAAANPRFVLEPATFYAYDFAHGVIDRQHDQLLGIIDPYGGGAVDDVSDDRYDPIYAAYSRTTGTLSYPPRSISSQRGPRLHWVSNDRTEGRLVNVLDIAYDSRHDEVVLALKDCFFEQSGPGAAYGADYSDCYHELRNYQRTGGRAFKVIEMPEEIRALDYDAENDMLMVSGQTRVFFLARSEQSRDTVTSDVDAGLVAREPAYEFPYPGTFQYCD